jgi:N-acetylglutamate synthase
VKDQSGAMPPGQGLPEAVIRRFVMSDYGPVLRLWREAGLPSRPHGRDARESLERELEMGLAEFLVAESDGRLVGVVLGTHDGRKGWVNRLAVSPAHRGRGLGRSLVQEVEARLAERGIEVIACLIEVPNTSSMSFFRHLGYSAAPDIVYFSKRRRPDS